MENIIALLILIADIYAVVKVVQSSAPTLSKVIWIVVILVLPIIGLVVWYLMGPGGKDG